MRALISSALLLAVASAFTTQPNAFTTVSPSVGERASGLVDNMASAAHRTRRATIVMDGKANGKIYVGVVPEFSYARAPNVVLQS